MLLNASILVYQFFGQVQPPPGVREYSQNGQFGLLVFMSNIIRLVTIIAGIWSLFNLIFAGFKYITASGDVKAIETAWNNILMSLLGLAVIVMAFTITAIISFLLFGDAGFILSPTIIGPSNQP